jgi:hypothetical protein
VTRGRSTSECNACAPRRSRARHASAPDELAGAQ